MGELGPIPRAGKIRDLLHPPPPDAERVVIHRVIPGATPSALFALRREPQYLVHFRPLIPVHVESSGRPLEEGDLERIWWDSPLGRSSVELRTLEVAPPVRVVDGQLRGPFRYWRHQLLVGRVHDEPTLIDVVDFRFVPGPAGRVFDALLVAPLLRIAFNRQQQKVAVATGLPRHHQGSR